MVDPRGLRTAYYFQWGSGAALGATSAVAFLEGGGPTQVEVVVPGGALTPGTTYHYRLVASNELGTTVGATKAFVTAGSLPPDVATGPPHWLSPTTVALTGTIICHGQPAAWYVEYGLSAHYGTRTVGGIAAGEGPENVIEHIQGLQPGMPYHYRLLIRRGASIRRGEDRVFMTPPVESLGGRLRAARTKAERDPAAAESSAVRPAAAEPAGATAAEPAPTAADSAAAEPAAGIRSPTAAALI